MGKLSVLSGQEVRRILERHGFLFIRQRGSHMILQWQSDDQKITVPVPDHKEIKQGVMTSIIRQSGVPRSAFEEN